MHVPPAQFVRDAQELGFEIGGWDETVAGIFGNGAEFVGSHAEVMAFLRGWMAQQQSSSPRDVVRRLFSMHTGEALIPPGSTFQVTSRPQVGSFRWDRLAIPDAIAEHFEIFDIRVGNRSQWVQAGTLDGSMFATQIRDQPVYRFDGPHKIVMTEAALHAFGREIDLDTCQVAMDITIVAGLKSRAPSALAFAAMIVGVTPLEPSRDSRMISATARSAAQRLAIRSLHDALHRLGEDVPFDELPREALGERLEEDAG